MKNVLVVDDTKNIRMILTKCLELEGYEVTTANDGKQALELFATHSFDLAFLDIKLPEMSGTEVLKRIRELGIKTPVIIITAYATVKNAVDCTNMGAVAYIQKPFSADKIKTILGELSNSDYLSSFNKESLSQLLDNAKASIDKNLFQNALEFSKKALSIELNNPQIYLLISKSYEGLNEKSKAERFYYFYRSFEIGDSK